MKLDFSALEKQINQDGFNILEKDFQKQLLYFQKQLHGQNTLSKDKLQVTTNLKKSQLSDHDDLMIGSAVLSEYFNSQKMNSSRKFDRQTKVNFSVMYPYEISKSLSPSNIGSEILQMKNKGILNHSALRFIKKEIQKDLSKSKDKKISIQSDQTFIEQKKLQAEPFISNQTHQQNDRFVQLQSHDELPLNTLLFEHFVSRENKNKHKFNDLISQKKQDNISNKMIIAKNQKNTTKYTNNYMKPIHNPLTSKKSIKLMPSQILKLQQQLKQVKSKPDLSLTINSPFTQKVISQRQSYYQKKNTSVFDSLHHQAYIRECKQSLQKQQINREIDQNVNRKKTLQNGYAKKYKVGGTFFQRLQKSIQKKYLKDYLRKKYQINEKTGQPFFEPDTKVSKHSYETLFHRSLQKVKNQEIEVISSKKKNKPTFSKQNEKQKDIISITNYSLTQKSITQTKQNSFERIQSNEQQIITVNNKSSQKIKTIKLIGKKFIPDNIKSSQTMIDENIQRIVSKITDIFYPLRESRKDPPKNNELEQHQSNEDFQKTYEAISSFTQQQYHILQPLFEQIQTIQKTSHVTIQIFKNLLNQFIKKLNFYDQLIMRQMIQTNKKAINYNKSKEFIDRLVDSRKKQPQNKELFSHKPRINIISSSMEKINSKYQADLFYV